MESGSGSGSNNDCGSSSSRYETENIDDLDFDDLNGIPKDEDRTGLGFDDINFDYDTDSDADEDQFYGGDLVIDEGSLGQNHNQNETNENDDNDDCEIIGIKTPTPSTSTSNSTLTSDNNTNTTTPNGVPNKKVIIIYKMNKNNSSSNSMTMNSNSNHHNNQNINNGIVNPNLPLSSLPPPKPKVPSQKHSDEFKPRPPTEEEVNKNNDNDETEDQELTSTLDGQVKKVRCTQCFEMFYGPHSEFILKAHIIQHHFDNKVVQFKSFAETFRKKRMEMGYTQVSVGQELGNMHGYDFTKSTISSFEALKLSFNNMTKIDPILRKWLADAESAAANDTSNILKKKRKERSCLDKHAYDTLEKVFRTKQKLTKEERSLLADKLDMDKEVLRVWFCNKKQREKRRRLNPEGINFQKGETTTSILGQNTSRPGRTSLGPPPALIPIEKFHFSTTARAPQVPIPTTSTCYAVKVPSSTSTSCSPTKVSSISTSNSNGTKVSTTTTTSVVSVSVTGHPGPAKLYANGR